MVLPQLDSVLMSVAHENTKGHMDTWGLGPNLWLSWCLRTMPPQGQCPSGWPMLSHRAMVLFRAGLLHEAMSGSVAQQQSGSELTSVVPVTT